jgi:5-methyltetrahydropteroyltriglutamate--homocysteine methyltransferase
MAKLDPPFRADHVGSLKRPEGLQRARERLLGEHTANRNLGAHANTELRALEDRAIEEAIRLQEAAGLRSITDGEFRRRTWWTDFMLGLDGVVENPATSAIVFRDAEGHVRPLPSVKVAGKIGWKRSVVRESFTFLKSRTRQTPKLTIPAPIELHYLVGGREGIDRSAYPEIEPFFDDLAAAYRREIAELARAGCTYLQLDDVTLAFLCDSNRREEVRSWGNDPLELLDTYVETMNKALAERPPAMTIAMHICRGNMSGHWAAEGGYEAVAERAFGGIDVDAFFLEYDTPRAGSLAALRYMPSEKTTVLGIVSTKSPELEDPDDVKRRIDEAGRFAPLDRLCLSPQCGFASNYVGNPVTIDDERRKLELVVAVARDVWGA